MPKLAACTETFPSIEAFDNTSSTIPKYCITQYTLQTLSDSLSAAIRNYTDLMNDRYNTKFKLYTDTVVESVGASVYNFVYQNSNKYFTYEVDKDTICYNQYYTQKNVYKYDIC